MLAHVVGNIVLVVVISDWGGLARSRLRIMNNLPLSSQGSRPILGWPQFFLAKDGIWAPLEPSLAAHGLLDNLETLFASRRVCGQVRLLSDDCRRVALLLSRAAVARTLRQLEALSVLREPSWTSLLTTAHGALLVFAAAP